MLRSSLIFCFAPTCGFSAAPNRFASERWSVMHEVHSTHQSPRNALVIPHSLAETLAVPPGRVWPPHEGHAAEIAERLVIRSRAGRSVEEMLATELGAWVSRRWD